MTTRFSILFIRYGYDGEFMSRGSQRRDIARAFKLLHGTPQLPGRRGKITTVLPSRSHILLREMGQRFLGLLRAIMEAKLQEWLRSFCAGLQGSILPRLSRTCVVCLRRREARSRGNPDTIGTTSHVVG